MLVVCFEFCLALPEVIHLPRGLEAVTRNWRNHDSTELSASTVPGWGIWRRTLQLQEVGTFFPLWVFYAIFFFNPSYPFLSSIFFFPPSPNTLDTYGSGNTFTLMIRWPENLNFAGILKSSSGGDEGGRRSRTLTSSREWGGNISAGADRSEPRLLFLGLWPKKSPVNFSEHVPPKRGRWSVSDEKHALGGTSLWQSDKPVQSAWMAGPSECPGRRQTDSSQRTTDPLCPAHGGKVVATVRTLACLVDALKQKGFVTFHDRSKICRSPGASGLRPTVEENIVDWRRQEWMSAEVQSGTGHVWAGDRGWRWNPSLGVTWSRSELQIG